MNTLYDIINILPLSLLAFLFFGTYAGIPEEGIAGFALSLVSAVWLIVLRHMKRSERLCSIGIVAVFLLGLIHADGAASRQLFIDEYLWVLWIIGFSAAALLAGILTEKYLLLRRAAAAALLVYCIVSTVLKRETGKGVFFLISFMLLVWVTEEVQRKWKKSGYPEIREHVTHIAPLLLTLCLAVCAFPAPKQPYDWQPAKKLWQSTVTGFNRLCGLITHPTDDYGRIGFSDKGSFLAGLGDNDAEVLSITSDEPMVKACKLTGCISGDFTGREWIFDTGRESCSRILDTMETSCAVRIYDTSYRSDYLKDTELQCETLFYNTRYIFAPAKIRTELTREQDNAVIEYNGSIISEKRQYYRYSYPVSCYVINYSNPYLAGLLDNAAPISEEEWIRTAKAEHVPDQRGCSYQDYQKYRSDVYETYCRSYGLSEKANAVLESIQRSTDSRYEAMKMLEAYLQNLEYSTDCGALPGSVTDPAAFVDYFLFTSKKGYCMHFATAFAVMANEMGVPCRYVQGYNARTDKNGIMTVRESNAHAWPEVYFDHVGWIAFEPTPGFSAPAGWAVRDRTDAPDLFDPEPYIPELYREQTENSDTQEEAEPEAEPIDPLIIIIPVAAVIGFLLLFCIISRLIARKKYRQMDCRNKFRYLTQQNLRLLGWLGFRREAEETFAEFSQRIMQSDSAEFKAHTGFISVYETVLYSDRTVTEADVRQAEQTRQALRGLVKKRGLRYRPLLLFG